MLSKHETPTATPESTDADLALRLNLCDQIGRAVIASGLPKSTASLRLGMSNSVVGKIMRGDVHAFSLVTLQRMVSRLPDLEHTCQAERILARSRASAALDKISAEVDRLAPNAESLATTHAAPAPVPTTTPAAAPPQHDAASSAGVPPARHTTCHPLVRAALAAIASGALSPTQAAATAREALSLIGD